MIKFFCSVFGVFLVSTSCVQASTIDQPFSVSIGWLDNRADASFTSTLDGFNPVELELDDLAMDDRASVAWAEATWQFRERWRGGLSWNGFSSDGLVSASESGNFGSVEWEVGASLTSEFDIDLVVANVIWDFFQNDRARAGIGLGVHLASLEFLLEAAVQGQLGEAGIEEVVDTTDRDLLAPLPNVALSGSISLSDDVLLRGYAGFLSLTIDKYDGVLFSSRASIEWFPLEHVGIGAAYQYLDANVEIDRRNRTDEFDLAFSGPIAFATFRF